MKNISLIIIACIILHNINLIKAQQEEPIILSPLIGEELDRVERDYFHLFPKIYDFEKAVFYLNNDNSLKVNITRGNNSITKDTTIKKYSSLDEIQKHIITRVFVDLRDKAGPNFTIQTGFGRLIAQKMVTLYEKRLFQLIS